MEHDDRDGPATMVVSRRSVLTNATYGLGAVLLLRPGLFDAPGPREAVEPLGAGPAPQAPANANPPVRDGVVAPASQAAPPRRAVHRSRLSQAGQPRAVCRGQQGVLVVGVGEDDEPVSWLTRDGSQWLEHHLASPSSGVPEVWGVAAHADRYIAVGSTLDQQTRPVGHHALSEDAGRAVTFAARRRMPTVWWTHDSTSWSGMVLGDLVDEHAQLVAVACHGGRLVAVGSVLDADGVQGAGGLAMTSDDGRNWTTALVRAGEEVFDEGSFTSIAATDDGWMATSTGMGGGAVWTSSDGLDWQEVAGSRRTFAGVTLQGIGVRDRRLFVAGTPVTDVAPRFYSSDDGGRSWEPSPLDVQMLQGPDALVHDLDVIAGDIVVVGTSVGVPVIEGGELDATN